MDTSFYLWSRLRLTGSWICKTECLNFDPNSRTCSISKSLIIYEIHSDNYDDDGDITTTIIPVTTMTMIFHSVCLYSDFSAESHYEAGTPSTRLRSHLLILSAQVRMIIITIKKLIWGWYHYYMRMISLFFYHHDSACDHGGGLHRWQLWWWHRSSPWKKVVSVFGWRRRWQSSSSSLESLNEGKSTACRFFCLGAAQRLIHKPPQNFSK